MIDWTVPFFILKEPYGGTAPAAYATSTTILSTQA